MLDSTWLCFVFRYTGVKCVLHTLVCRVFSDRLIDQRDRELFLTLLGDKLGMYFSQTLNNICPNKMSPVFGLHQLKVYMCYLAVFLLVLAWPICSSHLIAVVLHAGYLRQYLAIMCWCDEREGYVVVLVDCVEVYRVEEGTIELTLAEGCVIGGVKRKTVTVC